MNTPSYVELLFRPATRKTSRGR